MTVVRLPGAGVGHDPKEGSVNKLDVNRFDYGLAFSAAAESRLVCRDPSWGMRMPGMATRR